MNCKTDVLDRMKLSLNKDTNDSINEILSDIMQPTRGNLQSPFSTYPQMVRETPNPSLLFETFFHNMINYRNFFRRIGKTTRLYR